MAESTLSITRLEIETAIRRYLAYAPTGTLETDQDNAIDAIIKAGENMFYKGTRLPNEPSIHRWSFLIPQWSLSVTASDEDYDCPDDWGGFANPFVVASDNQGWRITVIPIDNLIELTEANQGIALDYPLHVAQRPLARDQEDGQRWEVVFYPTPQVSFTATVNYYSNPSAIPDDDQYPLGGQPHSLTLLQACLAAAELRENDGAEGVQFREFMRLMADSIAFDRAQNIPPFFGQNLDRSSSRCIRRHRGQGVTYNGS